MNQNISNSTVADNYQAWSINQELFPAKASLKDQIIFLLGYAVLAPSAHNTQPWTFSFQGTDTIIFGLNNKRVLKQSDPTHRQAYISLGCAINHFIAAAKEFNIHVLDFSVNVENWSTVKIRMGASTNEANNLKFDSTLLKSMVNRSCNRTNHTLSYETRLKLEQIAEKYDGIYTIFESELKIKIANIAAESQYFAMSQKLFRKELSDWVKSNTTDSSLGMPGFVMGLNNIQSIVLSRLISVLPPSKIAMKKEIDLLSKHTESLIFFVAEDQTARSFIELGMKVDSFLLDLTSEGLSAAFYTAPVEYDQYRFKIKNLISSNFEPFVLLRAGFAESATPKTPRLVAQQCFIQQ